MLWIKAFHIVFIASWFAGLFYLPRIFVNLAMVPAGSDAERARLLLMARKLLRFTTVLAVPALGLGLYLWVGYGIGMGPGSGWMHAKLALVLLVIGYHHGCSVMLRKLETGRQPAQPCVLPLVQRNSGATAHGHRHPCGGEALLTKPCHAQVHRMAFGCPVRSTGGVREPVPICGLARSGDCQLGVSAGSYTPLLDRV